MIFRFLAVLALLFVYHVAAVHGYTAFLLEEGDTYTVDRLVESLVGVLLFVLTLAPSRAKYVHREELRGIWEAIEEFDRDLKGRKNYAAAAGHALGKVRAQVCRIAWKLSGRPVPAEDPRTTARKVWKWDAPAPCEEWRNRCDRCTLHPETCGAPYSSEPCHRFVEGQVRP